MKVDSQNQGSGTKRTWHSISKLAGWLLNTEWLRSEEISGGHLVQSPGQAGLPRATM